MGNHLTFDVTSGNPATEDSSDGVVVSTASRGKVERTISGPVADPESDWKGYMDPGTNSVWYYNARTGQSAWSVAEMEAAKQLHVVAEAGSNGMVTKPRIGDAVASCRANNGSGDPAFWV